MCVALQAFSKFTRGLGRNSKSSFSCCNDKLRRWNSCGQRNSERTTCFRNRAFHVPIDGMIYRQHVFKGATVRLSTEAIWHLWSFGHFLKPHHLQWSTPHEIRECRISGFMINGQCTGPLFSRTFHWMKLVAWEHALLFCLADSFSNFKGLTCWLGAVEPNQHPLCQGAIQTGAQRVGASIKEKDEKDAKAKLLNEIWLQLAARLNRSKICWMIWMHSFHFIPTIVWISMKDSLDFGWQWKTQKSWPHHMVLRWAERRTKAAGWVSHKQVKPRSVEFQIIPS